MNNEVRLFVDGQHVIVFVNNIERNVLSRYSLRLGRRNVHVDHIARADGVAGLDGFVVHRDGAFFDESLQSRPGRVFAQSA